VSKRPHVVIFNPDQWRGEALGHLGHPAAVTPNLDRVVEKDGVSFSRSFCQNPVCTPSRCSFMTGWYPHVRGHRTMFHMLRPDEPVLLKTLKENGYFVWWGGKNDLVPGQNGPDDYCHVYYRPERKPDAMWRIDESAEWRGEPGDDSFFSFYVGELPTGEDGIYYDGDWANVQGAVDLIRDPPTDEPLCIFLPLTYPHPPYGVEEPWYSMIDREAVPDRVPTPENWDDKPGILKGIWQEQGLGGFSEERWRELRATYYGMCARVDHQFGMVVDALKAAGIYDDTAVFFFADHGDFTGDYGLVEKTHNTFEDCLSRVPFVIKPPSSVDVRPGVREALVELVDFPATVEHLTGIEPGHTHFGRSLVPLMEGENDRHRDAVFCEGGRLKGETHCMELESNQDPHGLYWPRLKWQREEGPEHTKAVMYRTQTHKYVRRLYEKDELYDLREDPEELRNIVDDPQHADVLSELKDRLLTFYLETASVVPHDTDRRGFG
jgi:arylsulfatase A-like enzyme